MSVTYDLEARYLNAIIVAIRLTRSTPYLKEDVFVKYTNGLEVEIGDEVQVDQRYKGTVVANLDAGQFTSAYPLERWAYLRTGLLINTNYGALLHYPPGHKDELVLLRRHKAPRTQSQKPPRKTMATH